MHARPTSNICIFSIRSRRNKRTKEKYEHAKEKQIEMERIDDELKVKYQKKQKTHISFKEK